MAHPSLNRSLLHPSPAGPAPRAPWRPRGGRAAPDGAVGEATFRPGVLQLVFLVTGLVLYSGARLALSTPSAEEELGIGAANPLYTLFQATLLLGSLLYAALRPGETLRRLLRLWPFLLLVGLAMASALWSQSFAGTVRRSLSLGTVVLFVSFAYAAAGPRDVMRVLVRVMLGLAVASLLEALLRPSVGFDTGDYANAVRGVFMQKNGLGAAMLLTTLALSFVVLDRGRLTRRDLGVLGFALVIIVLSRSTTSLLLSLAVAGCTVALLWMDRGGGWLAGTFVLLGLAATAGMAAFALMGSEAFFEAVGKDSTLTGRVQIWEGVRAAIAQRPMLGHGFAAFWLPDTNPAETIWLANHWQMVSAHSGYLETLVQLGRVGAATVAVVALWTVAMAAAALRGAGRRHGLWTLMFVGVLGFYNYSESALIQPDLFFVFWLLGTLAVTARAAAPPAPPRPRPERIVPGAIVPGGGRA